MSGVQEEAQDIPNLQLDATFNGQENDVPPLEDLTGGFQAPSLEQILAMVETMEGLSDEDRDDLKRQLLQGQGGQVPIGESGGVTSEALILLSALSLIIFAFEEESFMEDFDEGQVSNIANEAIEKLEQTVAAIQELTEDDKEKFRENVRKRIAEKLAAGLDNLHSEMRWAVILNTITWLLLVLLISIVVVFFGYKLYKSLKEKERKRDEKRRLKLQKKKK